MKKRNGDIAIVKIIFLMLIIIMHYNVPFPGKLYAFEGAYIYVDFFFVIIGYYLIDSIKNENEAIKSSYSYMWNRFKRFFPLVVIQSIILLFIEIIFFCKNVKDIIKVMAGMVLDCSFTSMIFPINYHYNGTLWFLSAVIIVGGIVHFFLKRYREMCSFLAPIVGVGLYNYMLIKNENLDIWYTFVTFRWIQDGLLRALAGMLLGIFVRSLVDVYKENTFEINDFIIIAVESAAIVSSACLTLLFPHTVYDFVQIALFMIIIAACNMRKEPLVGAVYNYIDKITFPMYIFQVISIRIAIIAFQKITWSHMLVILIIDFVISNIAIKSVDLFTRRITSGSMLGKSKK